MDDTSAAVAEASPGDAGENTTPGAPAGRAEEEVPSEQSAVEADEALALARALAAELEVRVSWGVCLLSLPRCLAGAVAAVTTRALTPTLFPRRKSSPLPVTCSAMR